MRQILRRQLVPVVVLTCVLGVFGVAGAVTIGRLPIAGHAHLHLPWFEMLLPFAIFHASVLNVQLRRESRSISLTEIPMAVGLAFCSPADLIAARCVAALFIQIAVWKQYRQPAKAGFNSVLSLAETIVALAVFDIACRGHNPESLWGWGAIELATITSSCFAAVAVGLVIQLVEDGFSVRELAGLLPTSGVQAFVVTIFGLIAVVTLDANPISCLLLSVGGLAFSLAYRAYSRLNERHLGLERVYRFTQAMSGNREMSDLLLGILGQAREMLHAEQALLTFLIPGEQGVEFSLGRSGTLHRGSVTILTDEPGSPMHTALSGSGPLLIPRNTHEESLREWLRARDLREIIAAPLRGDSGAIAVVAVVDRLGETRAFDREDIRLLETVANHASIALQNGRLIDRLRYESQHDPLTGLPNRLFFQRAVDQWLLDMPAGQVLAIGVLDLDSFKEVNDTLGHSYGDELLREVAQRLIAAGGQETIVARLGGDEFAVAYLTRDDASAESTGSALVASLHQPMLLGDVEVEVGGSLGISTTLSSGKARETLLKHADTAMYLAKQNANDVRLYVPAPTPPSADRLALVSKLRTAIVEETLEVFVQPKVALSSGRLTSVEALVRWRDNDRGFISPDEFIPLAERSGLIRPLTDQVLQRAISSCAGWQPVLPGVGIAVNLSVKSLSEDALVDRTAFLLRRFGLAPHLLTLEITESSIMSEPARMLAVLNRLTEHGIRLSIDDFGTGYSSLSYLQRLPVHEVKIDRSFITNLSADQDNAAIARSIIDLAKALSLDVVAEGVESNQDWAILERLACTTAQGYLIAKPMPIADLTRWHEDWTQTAQSRLNATNF